MKALLKSNTGLDDFEVEFDGDDISIIVPQQMLFDTNAAMIKFRMVTTLRDSIGAGKVSFVEVHEPRNMTPEGTDDEEDSDAADEDLSKLTVAELKKRCTDAGLATSGKKADLVERLSNA